MSDSRQLPCLPSGSSIGSSSKQPRLRSRERAADGTNRFIRNVFVAWVKQPAAVHQASSLWRSSTMNSGYPAWKHSRCDEQKPSSTLGGDSGADKGESRVEYLHRVLGRLAAAAGLPSCS
ncbi:uncharacterized protein LOC144102315 [Amblyomma americanum]